MTASRHFRRTIASLVPVRAVLIGVVLSIPCAPGTAADVAADQRELAERFRRLEAAALRVADAAAETDPDRAQQIRTALGRARAMGVDDRLDAVVGLLEEGRLAAARSAQEELAEQLDDLVRLMTADPASERIEAERRRIERLVREVGRAIRVQQSLRRRAAAAGDEPSESLADEQAALADRIARLAAEGAPSDGGPAGSRGQPGGDPAAPLADAERAMRSAAEGLRGDGAAGEDQTTAQRELENAARLAAERLRQLREQERRGRLAGLADRLRSMLAEQRAIGGDLAALAATETASRGARLAAGRLEGRQTSVADAARRAIRLIDEDGRSLVFAEAMRQAEADMRAAGARLGDGRVGPLTVALVLGAVESLEEMLEAVNAALDETERPAEPGGGPAGSAGEPGLIGQLGELRMLRAVQARLLRKTERFRVAQESGDVAPDDVRDALGRIAVDQRRLAEAVRHAHEQAAP